MTNLAAWFDVEELTVWQAACLWTGIAPVERTELSPAQQTLVTRRFTMLSGAIAAGDLKLKSQSNPAGRDVYYESCTVRRSCLREYARAHGHRPEFLFPTPGRTRPSSTADQLKALLENSPLLQQAEASARDAALERELAEAEAALAHAKGPAIQADSDFAAAYSWLIAEVVRRRKSGDPHDRDTMVVAIHAEYPGVMTKREAEEIYQGIPKEIRFAKIGRPTSGQRRKSGRK